MRSHTIATMIGLLLALGSRLSAGTISFTDDTFANANWQVSKLLKYGTGGSVTGTQALTGGNPGAFRDVVDIAEYNPQGRSAVLGFHERLGATYNPATAGPITSLGYTYDFRNIDTFGGGQAAAIALVQGDKIYQAQMAGTGTVSGWNSRSGLGLTVNDFQQAIVTSTITVDPNSHPDFGSTGSEIRFGFVTRNASINNRDYLRVGYDNWSFTLHTTTVQPVTLDDLLQGEQIVVGDKRFSGFANYTQSGDLDIPPSAIEVFPIIAGGETGLRFQPPTGWELNGANRVYNVGFDFLVSQIDNLPLITDSTLEITGNHVGGGEARLLEGVTDAHTLATLANKDVYINIANSGIDNLIDHQVFPGPKAAIRVSKGLVLQTRDGQLDNILVTHIDQTFSQVPEPSAFALLVIGITIAASVVRHAGRNKRAGNSPV